MMDVAHSNPHPDSALVRSGLWSWCRAAWVMLPAGVPVLASTQAQQSALVPAETMAEPSTSPWAQIYVQADEGAQLLVGLLVMLIPPLVILGVSRLRRCFEQGSRASLP